MLNQKVKAISTARRKKVEASPVPLVGKEMTSQKLRQTLKLT